MRDVMVVVGSEVVWTWECNRFGIERTKHFDAVDSAFSVYSIFNTFNDFIKVSSALRSPSY